MMRNKLFAILLAGLILFALCSCGVASVVPPAEKHKVALIVKSTQSEFFMSMFAGAEAAAAEYNLSLSINGPQTEEDYETQNQMVRQAVADGAEILIFSAIDFENNAPVIQETLDAGVKVVTVDSGVHSDGISTYIGTNNYEAGRQAAEAALNSGFGQLHVGLVNYDTNSANGQERERGVRDVLMALDNVSIVSTINVLASASDARIETTVMLRAHPEINVLIAFNEPTAVGAAEAVEALKAGDRTWLVGFDSNVETIDLLQTGVVDALVVQNPYAMGYLGVESAYKLLNGQEAAISPTVDTATTTVKIDNMFTVDSQKTLFAFS